MGRGRRFVQEKTRRSEILRGGARNISENLDFFGNQGMRMSRRSSISKLGNEYYSVIAGTVAYVKNSDGIAIDDPICLKSLRRD